MPVTEPQPIDHASSKEVHTLEPVGATEERQTKRFKFFGHVFVKSSLRLCWSALALIVAVILFLSWLQVSSTWIALNVSAGLVTIKVSEPVSMNEVLVKDLSWSSNQFTIILPNGKSYKTDYFDLNGGPITVPPIKLKEETILGIRINKGGERFSTTFDTSETTVEFGFPSGVMLSFGNGVQHPIEGEFLKLVLQDDGVDPVYMSWQQIGKERLIEAMSVQGISFWKEVANRGTGTRLSTVQNGLLVLEDKGGERIDLREGEPITFKKLDGMLRSLVLEDLSIQVYFDGLARGISTGYSNRSRSMMPSILDWLINISWIKALLAFFAVLIASSLPLFTTGEKS